MTALSLPRDRQAVQQMTNEVRSEPPKESAVMLPNDPETQVEAVRRQHGVRLLLHLSTLYVL
jgi:LDH2 family malate/lactate/ureidoglycolate dehydrogenase